MKYIPAEEENTLRLFLFCFSIFLICIDVESTHRLYSNFHAAPYRPLPIMEFLFGNERIGFAPWISSYLIFVASLLGSAFGFKPKILLPIAAASAFIHIGTKMGGDIQQLAFARPYRANNLVLPTLILLAASPKRILELPLSALLRQSRLSRLPTLFLIKLTITIFFFASGISKIKNGLQWADGETLQNLMLRNSIRTGNGLAWEAANHPLLCQLMSIVALAFELGAPLLLFVTGGEIAFVTIAIAFHVGIYFLLDINFFNSPFVGTYFVFLRASWVAEFVKRAKNIAGFRATAT